jgi:hypothetical protein
MSRAIIVFFLLICLNPLARARSGADGAVAVQNVVRAESDNYLAECKPGRSWRAAHAPFSSQRGKEQQR